MATWRMPEPKKFWVEFTHRDSSYHDLAREEVEYGWNYNTTADVLEITTSYPQKRDDDRSHLYGPSDAAAELYTLASWYATYNGKDRLKELLKEIL